MFKMKKFESLVGISKMSPEWDFVFAPFVRLEICGSDVLALIIRHFQRVVETTTSLSLVIALQSRKLGRIWRPPILRGG